MRLQKLAAPAVFRVVGIIGRIEGTGIDDQRAPSSDLRISSTRRETSLRPLRPAAPSLCRPGPRMCASIASRVSSETVIPLRSAS